MWGIQQIPGIPPIVKTVIVVIIGVMLLLYCLQYVGDGGHGIRFGLFGRPIP